MTRGLLDINFLVALFDEAHVFNERAHDWLAEQSKHGIATCPLTENGLVRMLANPAYSKLVQVSPARVISRRTRFIAHHDHAFWPDDLTLRQAECVHADQLLGHRQVTDVYLLALAVRHGGRLVTFDQSVATQAVPGFHADSLVVV
jgi:toxin-antitoxin system PIN domain toxin